MNSDIQQKFKPDQDMRTLFLHNFIWGAFGLVLGILSNNVSSYLIEQTNIKNIYFQLFIQLTICSALLAYIHTEHNYFGWTWQNITPGLFFVSFFFGGQFLMYERLGSLTYKLT